MEKITLKSCPFCGSTDTRIMRLSSSSFVFCQDCYCQTRDGKEADAIAAWNRRSDERPKGEWIGLEGDGYADGSPVYNLWSCSCCRCEHKGEYDTLPSFCPDCGAEMYVAVKNGGRKRC